MPSNTAFMENLPAAAPLIAAHNSMGESASELVLHPPPERLRTGISPRLLMGTVEALRGLGIDVDTNSRELRALRMGIITNHSLYMLYNAHVAMRHAEAAKETAIAVGEATALAALQQWQLIAQAFIAATMVYSSFKVGEKFGSGDWSLPNFNISEPTVRRAVTREIEKMTG